jgi:hypothetical protein
MVVRLMFRLLCMIWGLYLFRGCFCLWILVFCVMWLVLLVFGIVFCFVDKRSLLPR